MTFIILGSLGLFKNMEGQRQWFLAKELSKKHKVIFVETHDSGLKNIDNITIDCCLVGNWLTNSYDLKSMEIKLKNILNKYINKNENNVVIFEIPLSGYINLIPIFKSFNCKIHYDYIDNWRYFYGGNVIDTERTKELIANINSISATSDYLVADLKNRFNIQNIPIISNAYGVLSDVHTTIDINNQKINICYYGAIGEWFDWKFIKNNLNKNICFHIFGNYAERQEFPKYEFNNLLKNENFKYYGYLERQEIKQILNYMDYTIIPFIDSPLIYATDAVKAYEMAACYKKILYPNYMKEMYKFPEEIRIEYDRNNLLNIENKNYEINKELINSFISQNTWEIRTKKLLEVIDNGR